MNYLNILLDFEQEQVYIAKHFMTYRHNFSRAVATTIYELNVKIL